jgi:YidC/Oxa1 family membrane protein insertase
MFDQIRDVSLEGISALLAFFYSLPVVGGSYGVAIILLTLAVMVLLMPLTLRATRSTIKMTMLQPQLKQLQKEYKDDRQTLNQEMMALYQSNGVNPIGGCLPMLAQLPVFLLLFNVLRGLSRRVSDLPYYAISQRAQEISTGVAADPAAGERFDPQYLDESSELYQSLSQQTEIGFGPFDLSARAWDVLLDNVLTSIPYLLMILFVVLSSYYQQRQISSRRGAVPDNPTPQQQTQQQLLRILPLMSGIWSFLFPAGLVLYWATSNLFRIGQQAYISRALYAEDGEGTQAMEAANEARRISESDDDDDDSSGSDGAAAKASGQKGKPASTKRSGGGGKATAGAAGSNGSSRANGSRDGSSVPADRNEAWAQRRAARQARAKTVRKTTSSGSGGSTSSSRVTPKGTKPTAAKKKRKR